MLQNVTKRNKKFWEGLIAYFPLIQRGLHRKRRLQQFFVVFTDLLPSNDGGIHRQTHRLSLDKIQSAQKMEHQTINLL
jgi:hypothetical protein